MNFFKRQVYDNSQMPAYRSKNDKTILGLYNLDYWRGRKDGKKSPSAGIASVDLIQSEELLDRNESVQGINYQEHLFQSACVVLEFNNILFAFEIIKPWVFR